LVLLGVDQDAGKPLGWKRVQGQGDGKYTYGERKGHGGALAKRIKSNLIGVGRESRERWKGGGRGGRRKAAIHTVKN